MRFAHCGLLLAGLLVIMPGVVRGQEFEALVKRVPAGANTLVLLNVEKILQSPVALRENWKAKHEHYAEGFPCRLRTSRRRVRLGDGSGCDGSRGVGIGRDAVAAPVDALAGTSGGRQEMIAHPVTAHQRLRGAIRLDIVSAMTPCGPAVGGPLDGKPKPAQPPSCRPSLAEASGHANNLGTPIILGHRFCVTPTRLRKCFALLKASDLFCQQARCRPSRLAQTIAGIRGLTLASRSPSRRSAR